MKVLDAGTESLSNADVLNWIQDKHKQIADEDRKDKEAGKKPSRRPDNFISALTKHERELKSTSYPYTRNVKVYSNHDVLSEFERKLMETVVQPFTEHRVNEMREQGMSEENIEKEVAKEQEAKLLTETEQLMVYNHAPKCPEMLQPMVENIDDRLAPEEQEAVVQAVMEVYRKQETGSTTTAAG
ncbi:hypothetical protein B0A50_00257 [Salinomyces thailandicus]|uniref:DNA-directed RNA polymerase III subunit RPC9 n=1 Tax=Salinomyces thailandicus TaxID=706561 RepID=A0A4U0UG09_9PEZI|nr:hypothetical protein B0A50_00257 [Salinomyces thailandica]